MMQKAWEETKREADPSKGLDDYSELDNYTFDLTLGEDDEGDLAT